MEVTVSLASGSHHAPHQRPLLRKISVAYSEAALSANKIFGSLGQNIYSEFIVGNDNRRRRQRSNLNRTGEQCLQQRRGNADNHRRNVFGRIETSSHEKPVCNQMLASIARRDSQRCPLELRNGFVFRFADEPKKRAMAGHG